MTYSDLLHNNTFEEIVPHMNFLIDNRDALIKEYSELYHRLQAVEPEKSDNHIMIVGRWEGTSPDIDMTCTVRDRNNRNLCVLGRYMYVNELLGMEIEIDEDVIMSEPEVVAGLFWELSKCHLYHNDKEHFAILRAWELE